MITNEQKIAAVMESIRELGPEEQLDVLEKIAGLLRESLPYQARHSILELEGLGAEIWRGIRSQEYVDRERSTWDG